MSERKYTSIKQYDEQIIQMREAGLCRQAIADELGLTKKQIENWVTRYNKQKAAMASGEPPKRQGRPRTRPLSTTEEYEKEIARLEMENKLLRSFLELCERM